MNIVLWVKTYYSTYICYAFSFKSHRNKTTSKENWMLKHMLIWKNQTSRYKAFNSKCECKDPSIFINKNGWLERVYANWYFLPKNNNSTKSDLTIQGFIWITTNITFMNIISYNCRGFPSNIALNLVCNYYRIIKI